MDVLRSYSVVLSPPRNGLAWSDHRTILDYYRETADALCAALTERSAAGNGSATFGKIVLTPYGNDGSHFHLENLRSDDRPLRDALQHVARGFRAQIVGPSADALNASPAESEDQASAA